MRILYVHQYFSTRAGATGTRSYELARRAIERGHSVTMLCGSADRGVTGLDGPFRRGRRRGTVDGIDVLEFDLRYSNRDSMARRSTRFASFAARTVGSALREPCDIIVATSTPLTAAVPGIAGRWLRGKPFVFEVRDLWPELPRAMGVRNPFALGVMSALEWAAYRSADKLISLAPGITRGITRRGVAAERVAMIPNGCDREMFAAPAKPWRPAGVPDDALVAVFAGAHGRANGLGALLDAANVLLKRGRRDIYLLLFGDGMEKPALVRRASDECLTNVAFHDSVDKEKLAGALAAADIGLQILANVPAFYDGTSPNKFFDYLAAGLPIVTNYPGWLAEVLTKNGCGFAVPPDNPNALAEALIAAADDRPRLVEMGKRSRRVAEREFDRRLLADRWVDWVESAVR